MMRELTALTVIMTVAGIGVLAAVYVWSGDSGRRTRAWRLIRLLLSRRAAQAPPGRARTRARGRASTRA